MKKVYLLPTLGLSILLLAASCNTTPDTGSGVNTDPTGIQSLTLRVLDRGTLEWEVRGELGLYVFRIGDALIPLQQTRSTHFVMGGPPFYLLESQGLFHAYLRRARDGKWVHYWLSYTHTIREDGTAEFRLDPTLNREAVPTEEALPFILTRATSPDGKVYNEVPRLRNPTSPITIPNPICLQPGAVWPYGQKPLNTPSSSYYPLVAPENPPAFYFSRTSHEPGFALIQYLSGTRYGGQPEYAGATDAPSTYTFPVRVSPHAAAPPQDGSTLEVKWVIYATLYDSGHPLYRRWVRLYPRNPFRLRMEGGRLVCEDFGGFVKELMPEGFNFPHYNPDTGVFEMSKGVPMVLTGELDPYSGR